MLKVIFVLSLLFLCSCAGMQSSGMRYNPYEEEWQYAGPDAQLKFNPYEKRWEYVK